MTAAVMAQMEVRPALGYRVLVVDDAATNRNLIEAFLKRLGFQCLMAEDGAQALQRFEHDHPDIVLMDLMMPNMDGVEATRRIRDLPQRRWVPLLIVSALDDQDDVVRGLEAGADDYLTKPIAFPVFAAKMRNIARSLDLQRERVAVLQQFAVMADTVLDGLIRLDEAGTIVFANQATAELLKCERTSLRGRAFAEFVVPELWQTLQVAMQHCCSRAASDSREVGNAGSWRDEVLLQNQLGEHLPVELSMRSIMLDGQPNLGCVLRDITERKRVERDRQEYTERLRKYRDDAEVESELARELIERQIYRGGLQDARVHSWIQPAAHFSGDLALAARSPQGRLYIMLADATGHGLAAAVSVLPAMSCFYRGVVRNTALPALVAQINNLLMRLLPCGRFVSAALACIDDEIGVGELWVGGVPDVLLLDADGQLLRRFASRELPLGLVAADGGNCQPEAFEWRGACQLGFYSDGLVEAADARGSAFGETGLLQALARCDGNERLAAVRASLSAHLGDALQAHDDISLLLVDLAP